MRILKQSGLTATLAVSFMVSSVYAEEVQIDKPPIDSTEIVETKVETSAEDKTVTNSVEEPETGAFYPRPKAKPPEPKSFLSDFRKEDHDNNPGLPIVTATSFYVEQDQNDKTRFVQTTNKETTTKVLVTAPVAFIPRPNAKNRLAPFMHMGGLNFDSQKIGEAFECTDQQWSVVSWWEHETSINNPETSFRITGRGLCKSTDVEGKEMWTRLNNCPFGEQILVELNKVAFDQEQNGKRKVIFAFCKEPEGHMSLDSALIKQTLLFEESSAVDPTEVTTEPLEEGEPIELIPDNLPE